MRTQQNLRRLLKEKPGIYRPCRPPYLTLRKCIQLFLVISWRIDSLYCYYLCLLRSVLINISTIVWENSLRGCTCIWLVKMKYIMRNIKTRICTFSPIYGITNTSVLEKKCLPVHFTFNARKLRRLHQHIAITQQNYRLVPLCSTGLRPLSSYLEDLAVHCVACCCSHGRAARGDCRARREPEC